MPIRSVETPTSYDAEMLVKAKQQQQTEGKNAVRLIEDAMPRPTDVERLRNPNSTLSVLA